MPISASFRILLSRFLPLIHGAINEIESQRQPLLPPKRFPLRRYALCAALAVDLFAALAVGCWLLARSSALPNPAAAFDEAIVMILSVFAVAFAFSFYIGSTQGRGPLRTEISSLADVLFLVNAVFAIACGFVLVYIHKGFVDGERVLLGAVYQILLHTAGLFILALPGHAEVESGARVAPSAVLLGFWVLLSICFGVHQIACADYRAVLGRGGG